MSEDPSNTLTNPAAGECGISTSTSLLHGMNSLNQNELSSILNYRDFSIFTAWQGLSTDNYSEQAYRMGVRYRYSLFRWGIGYKISYDDITGYGSDKKDWLCAGFRINHHQTIVDLSAEQTLSTDAEDYPGARKLFFSLGQKLDSNTILAFGIDAASQQKINLKLGCNYNITDYFETITSWESRPGRFGLGCSFLINRFNLSYAVQSHPELRWTHSIGIAAMLP